MQFKQLVRSLDKSHGQFMKVMGEDPSVDFEQLSRHYGKNYTQMLGSDSLSKRKKNLSSEQAKGTAPLNDAHDQRKLREGKIAYIGIEPRVDTNLKMSKQQTEDEDLVRMQEAIY